MTKAEELGVDQESSTARTETPASTQIARASKDYMYAQSVEYRAYLESGEYLTPQTHCTRCIAAGHPSSYGSPRECGFDAGGIFKSRNWSCGTLDELRRIAYDSNHATRWDDQSAAVIPNGNGGFIILSYYKDRGCTERAYVAETCEPITLQDAEKAITEAMPFIAAYGKPNISVSVRQWF